jgi:hypothetical protein
VNIIISIKEKMVETFEWYKDIKFYLKYWQLHVGMSTKETRALKIK